MVNKVENNSYILTLKKKKNLNEEPITKNNIRTN